MEEFVKCPVKSSDDWKYSVDKLGEDKTWYIYDKLGQQIPTQKQVDSLVQRAEQNVRPSSPQEVVLRLKDTKTIKQLEDVILGYKGIISSKRFNGKIYLKAQDETSKFDHGVLAQKMVDEVNANYPGLLALNYDSIRSRELGRGLSTIDINQEAWHKYFDPNNDKYFEQGLLFKKDIGKILVDSEANDREELSNIFVKSSIIGNAYDYLDNLAELIPDMSTEHKELVNVFNVLKTKNPDLKIKQLKQSEVPKYISEEKVKTGEYKDWLAFYSHRENSVYLITDALKKQNKSVLVGTLLHEIIHGFTSKINDQYNKILSNIPDHLGVKGVERWVEKEKSKVFTQDESDFLTEIERIYNKAFKETHKKNRADYGYTSLEEFMSDALSNQKLIDTLKTMYDPEEMKKYKAERVSFFGRIKQAILKMLGMDTHPKSYHYQAFSSIMDYIYNVRRPHTGIENIQLAKVRDNINVAEANPTHERIVKALEDNEDFYNKLDVRYPTLGLLMDQSKLGGLPYELRDVTSQENYDRYIGVDLNTKHQIDKSFKSEVADIKLKYGISDQAAKDLEGYLNNMIYEKDENGNLMKRPGFTFLSNVTLVDHKYKLAGKADIVVIDKENKVHIFKIKTRQGSYDNYDNDRTSNVKGERPLPFSDFKRDQVELTTLKNIFEEVTNTKVEGLHIIPLRSELNEKTNTVERYTVDKSFNGKDVIDIPVGNLVGRIKVGVQLMYRGKEITMDTRDSQDVSNDAETEEMIKDTAKRYEARLKKLTSGPSPEQEVFLKIIKSLERRLSITGKRGGSIAFKAQADFINKLMREEDTQKALSYAVSAAHKIIMDTHDALEKLKASGNPIIASQLYKFKDAVSAFDILSDYQDLLTRKYNLGAPEGLKESDPKIYEAFMTLRSKLDNAIKWKNAVKDDYKVLGLEALAEKIFPFWTRTRSEYREKYKDEYRRVKYSKDKGIISKEDTPYFRDLVEHFDTNMIETEYVETKLNQEGETIDQVAKTVIRKELKKASQDTNMLMRWIGNVLDSPDSAVAALVKAFVTYDDTARIEIETERLKMLPVVDEWYEYSKQFGHNYQKAYDFMLEKDLETGEPTGHIVSKSHSALRHEYATIQQILDGALSEDETEFAKAIMSDWKKTNMPLNVDAYGKAYLDYLKELVDSKQINPAEYERLRYEQLKVGLRARVEDIQKETDSPITDGTVDLLTRWFQKNVWKYREPAEQWVNPQWKRLEKLLREQPNDPRTKIYNMIVDASEKADAMSPTSVKLRTRIPGILKDKIERFASGQNLADIGKGVLSKALTFKVDDTHRVNTDLVDGEGNARYFVPEHFTCMVTKTVKDAAGNEYQVFDPKEQSFNLANLYYHYLGSAIEFQWKNNILPEMELARYIFNNRDVIKKDSRGNIKYQASRFLGNENELSEQTTKGGNVSQQFDSWLLYALYGQGQKDLGVIPGTNIDAGKLTGALQRFTALNLLALNYVAGFNSVALTEVSMGLAAFANREIGKHEWVKAQGVFMKNLPGIMGDIGSKKPENIVSLLLREFNVAHSGKFRNLTNEKYRDISNSSPMFFVATVGWWTMQVKLLLAMLEKRRAYNSKGEDIGSILSHYKVVDGKLKLDEVVDEIKSKWDNQGRRLYEHRVRGFITKIHGDQSDLGRVAAQGSALGSMAMMFRRFVVPTFLRRWGPKRYEERTEEYEEGMYVTTAKFGRRLIRNLEETKSFMLSREWATADDMTKANVIRTIGEVITITSAIILANVAISLAKNAQEQQDEDTAMKMWNFMAYQALRLKAEFLFYVSPQSAMQILRSPAASISMVENTIKLATQVMGPGWQDYQQGPFKGHLKLEKTLIDMSIGVKQYYRLREMGDQVGLMKSGIIRSQ
jgi:hypothetical protein